MICGRRHGCLAQVTVVIRGNPPISGHEDFYVCLLLLNICIGLLFSVYIQRSHNIKLNHRIFSSC